MESEYDDDDDDDEKRREKDAEDAEEEEEEATTTTTTTLRGVEEEEEEEEECLSPREKMDVGKQRQSPLTTTTLTTTLAAETKEQSQSRANELGLHEQWRSVLRAERRAKEEERKERKENAKERRVDQLDARTEWLDRELDAAEKQTRSMAKLHLNAAERMYDAALKCKKQMRMDLEKSMRRAFDAFVKEAEEVRKAHEKHTALAERAMKEMKLRFEHQEMNVHFPRHASTIAEIKNKAEEERANLRSTVGAKLERAKRDVVRASGGERERPSLHGDTNAANDVGDEINNDNDNNDDDDDDDEILGENEVEELMTFVNAAAADDDASPSSIDAYHPKHLHHRFCRVNRLKDAQIARMEENLRALTREREKWHRKTAVLERTHSEDARRVETHARIALRRARDMRAARAKKSREHIDALKQKLSDAYDDRRTQSSSSSSFRHQFSFGSSPRSKVFWKSRDDDAKAFFAPKSFTPTAWSHGAKT